MKVFNVSSSPVYHKLRMTTLQPGHMTAMRRAAAPETPLSTFVDTIHSLARQRVLPSHPHAVAINQRLAVEAAHIHTNLHDAARMVHACARLQLCAPGRTLIASLDPDLPRAALEASGRQQRHLAHALTSLLWACAALATPPSPELRRSISSALSALHDAGVLDASALQQVWAAAAFATRWQRGCLVDEHVWVAAQQARRDGLATSHMSAMQRDVTLQLQRLLSGDEASCDYPCLQDWEATVEGRVTPLIKADVLLRAVRLCVVCCVVHSVPHSLKGPALRLRWTGHCISHATLITKRVCLVHWATRGCGTRCWSAKGAMCCRCRFGGGRS